MVNYPWSYRDLPSAAGHGRPKDRLLRGLLLAALIIFLLSVAVFALVQLMPEPNPAI